MHSSIGASGGLARVSLYERAEGWLVAEVSEEPDPTFGVNSPPMPNIDDSRQQPKGFPVSAEPTGRNRELALLVCSGALRLKKEHGKKVVSQAEIIKQTDHRPSEVDQGITLALQYGWLARRDDHLGLTAAGIWVAKQALNLPR
jgi:hypothetical protein